MLLPDSSVVEQVTVNHSVVGSIPTLAVNLNTGRPVDIIIAPLLISLKVLDVFIFNGRVKNYKSYHNTSKSFLYGYLVSI